MKNSKVLTESQIKLLRDRFLDPKDFILENEKGNEVYFYDRVTKNTLILSKDSN